MSVCWLLAVSPTFQEFEMLSRLEMPAFETTSWRISGRSAIGMLELLRHVGAVVEIQGEPDVVILAPIGIHRPDGTKYEGITNYFIDFTKHGLDFLGFGAGLSAEAPQVLAFNLMPFQPRAAIVDRVLYGIITAIVNVPAISSTTLGFFVRASPSFAESSYLRALVQSKQGPSKAVIIGLEDAYAITIERNPKSTSNEPRILESRIPRSRFEKILIRDDRELLRSLVYQTNINIGHFDIGSCHVRTHYDLEDFLKHDSVFEKLYSNFCNITEGFHNITIIGVGLEGDALTILGNRLQHATSSELKLGINGRNNRVAVWQGNISEKELVSNSRRMGQLIGNSDCILVLTDIVNTGGTVDKAVAKLRKIFQQIAQTTSRKDRPATEIRIYAVAKMNNSPTSIKASVTIKRPYFKKTSCPLCDLGQPITTIHATSWKEDFKRVEMDQLTPLDFWEMVRDCDAIKVDSQYAGGKKLSHRVDTGKIIDRYSRWLANVIANKYRDTWGDKYPDAIATVSEDSGIKFARLVSQALNIASVRMIHIPRPVLDQQVDAPEKIKKELTICQDQHLAILIVDDGINLGGTIRKLVRLVKAYNIEVAGALVLDNRLDREELHRMQSEMGNKIVPLYSWPSSPIVV